MEQTTKKRKVGKGAENKQNGTIKEEAVSGKEVENEIMAYEERSDEIKNDGETNDVVSRETRKMNKEEEKKKETEKEKEIKMEEEKTLVEITKVEEKKNSFKQKHKGRGKVCPYLGTINRNLLDFDFEKLCSCSLTNLHVYACLVCGLYFQGIGKNTHAYKHSLEKNHYVFINLETCKTYCVPENYEIEDASLNDIKYFLKPFYTKKQVEEFCKTPILGKSLDGADFIPGCVGLNNLKNTDYCNVIIQFLCSVVPLRNVLLLMDSKKNNAKNLIIILSDLIKKMCNPQNFKGVVSPHEFLQAVGIESNKNFKIGKKQDPYDFFCWIINKIYKYSEKQMQKKNKIQKKGKGDRKRKHEAIKDDNRKKMQKAEENEREKESEQEQEQEQEKEETNELIKWPYEEGNIIDYCFDGELLVKTKKESNGLKNENEKKEGDGNAHSDHEVETYENGTVFKTVKIPFRTLSLTLPNVPIFKNVTESNIIPQVSIFELLTKFDGETESTIANEKNPCTLSICKLPKYLIFIIKRFSKNNFFVEKNGTIVNFVMKNLDMKEYIHPKHIEQNPITKYNLIANIFHSGTVTQGIYKIHVLNQSSNEWYEIEDLHVKPVLPQLILLSESCMQLYQRHDVQLNGDITSVFPFAQNI